MDQNCELIQYNKGNIQPNHVILSDKSQAATASEIIEVRSKEIKGRDSTVESLRRKVLKP